MNDSSLVLLAARLRPSFVPVHMLLYAAALVSGFYLLSMTFIMRESTEGKWTNRIEDLWVRLDDRHKVVGETTKALVLAIAQKVTGAFDRIVGPGIVSARLVGISGSLSFTSLFLLFGVAFGFFTYIVNTGAESLKRTAPDPGFVQRAPILFIVAAVLFLILSLICLVFALVPILFNRRFFGWFSCMPTATFLYLIIRAIARGAASGPDLILLAALISGLASDIALVVIVRQSLRWLVERTTIPRIVGAVVAQVALTITLIYLPFQIIVAGGPAKAKSVFAVGMFMLCAFNIPTALASVSFVFLLFVVVLHRLTWPLLSRLTYILTRRDLLEKRRTIRTISVALILFALRGLTGASIIVRMIETLNK
jgi:hypothetical protein